MSEKSNNKGMLIVAIVSWAILLGLCGWELYDSFFKPESIKQEEKNGGEVDTGKTDKNDIDDAKIDSEKYDKEVKSMEDNYYAQYLPSNISKEDLNLYNTLVTKNNTYGLYFGKSVNINNISNDEMIELALINYINDNKLKIGSASCFMDTDEDVFTGKPYGDAKDCDVKPISKTTLDNYIKEKYNTEREFVSDGEVKMISISQAPIGYIYDSKSNAYYYGSFPQSGGIEQISRWLIDVSKDNDSIYFYDKAMYCDASGSWGFMGCQLSRDTEKRLFEYTEEEYSDEIKELVREGSEDENSYDLNYDYIFENYKLPIYKHTFKKAADGNYYWYSSEIYK
jgi:hypothetical protein